MVAEEELWIIGTRTLSELTGKLEVLKREHEKDPQLNYFFLQDKFDIITKIRNPNDVSSQSTQFEFAKLVLNDLIYHLNTRPKLATTIVIIIGPEILEDANFMRVGFSTVFTWLVDEIQFAILHMINSAPTKVGNIVSPEVSFVKMLPKLEGTANADFKTGRRKFNKILETLLQQYHKVKFSFINIGEITSEAKEYFHKNGSLNDSGNLTYWVALSNIISTKIARREEAKRPVEDHAQTDDFLLDDYIKIQAEKVASDRDTQRDKKQEYRSRNNSADHYRSNNYDRNYASHKRSNSFAGNDRYHFYRR